MNGIVVEFWPVVLSKLTGLTWKTAMIHLRPETQAKLEANAAALGMSVADYLEALVEKELPPETEGSAFSGAQFQKEHGIWVYRTGDPMPPSLVEDTLATIRREREAKLLGNIPT